jgi:hypothetical protein
MNFYAEDKIRELKNDHAFRDKNQLFAEELRPRHRPLIGALVAVTGRALQRVGIGLEGWAAAAEEPQVLKRVTR